MEQAAQQAPLRTRVYVDGSNLYYGCLKGTPYKWLDLLELFERHILSSISLPHDHRRSQLLPVAVKYFTANILEKAAKAPDSLSSQARYHTALRKLHGSRIALIKGCYSLIEFKAKLIDVEAPATWPRDCRDVLVWRMEEKQTDVKLALQLYHDAVTGQIDHAIVVTNDTDIAPALELIRWHTRCRRTGRPGQEACSCCERRIGQVVALDARLHHRARIGRLATAARDQPR